MTSHAKGAIIVFGAMFVAMAIFPPAALGGKNNPWGMFIYDYQTLITGILAVGGAWATVNAMNKTDRAAYARHQQLVELSLAKDRIRIDRTVHPLVEELEIVIEDISDWRPITAAALFQHMEHFQTRIIGIEELLDDRQLRDAEDLFDGETAHALTRANISKIELRNAFLAFTTHVELMMDASKSDEYIISRIDGYATDISGHVGTMEEFLTIFCASLRKLDAAWNGNRR